ncbi:uncharacterized protein CBL_12453 [Carabus blaptoides fortunei]
MSLSTFIKAAVCTILGGVGWLGYEVHSMYKILNTSLDTSVIDHLEDNPKKFISANKKYICIESEPKKSPSFIDRFWDSVTYSYARRLLNIAQSDDRNARVRAVDALAKIRNLDGWHYSLLAHTCDARTAVGLARTKDVDLKFFVNPPDRYVYYNHDKIVSWMKHFLISLTKHSEHPCMAYFIKKAFVNVQDVGRMVEHDISSAELRQCIQSADDILPLCVQSILHHSTIDNNARDIVQMNGLPLLMELYKRYQDNKDIVMSLVKIISNISVYPELLQDIYRSGWIGVLAKLLKHDDIRIYGPAARALANLDSDDHVESKFESKIYLLHPTYRSQANQDVDVVLVHGLLGGVFFTWRQRDLKNKSYNNDIVPCPNIDTTEYNTSDPSTREFLKEVEERRRLEWNEIGKDFEFIYNDCPLVITDQGPYSCSGEEICSMDDKNRTQCWPKDWLPKDCSNLRIIGVNYDTSLSLWIPMCPITKTKGTLDERSDEILEKLLASGVGKRPVIWLTHSMGGLLVKNMLVKAWESKDPDKKRLCENTKGVVFYSTPHKGTNIASFNQTTSLFLWPSVEVRELKAGSPALLKLHNRFLELLQSNNVNILSFVETEGTSISPLKFNFHLVAEQSAKLDIGECYEIPLDHLGICKPMNRHSFLYQKGIIGNFHLSPRQSIS